MDTKIPLSKQIQILLQYVKALQPQQIDIEQERKVVTWVRDVPEGARPKDLLIAVRDKFKLKEEELAERLKQVRKVTEIEPIVPTKGWIADYLEYTKNTEPPTAFHFFAGLTVIGASLARNIFLDMGAYKIFPALQCTIIAPSGKCRKTSACNIAINLYKAVGGYVLADKMTPEALIQAFTDRTSAVGLLYAPELAVFLNKQKYNEGLVPLLTALFDCPKEWSSGTIMRGENTLRNVAVSALFCSTMDWIQTAIPRDAFGGGFMSRLIFITQYDTPRVFPIPPPLDLVLENKLKGKLFGFTKLKGAFKLDKEAEAWHDKWYRNRHAVGADKHFAGYLERKPDHLKRLAMLLTVSEWDPEVHKDFVLTAEKLQQALAVIQWIEEWLPSAFEQMATTTLGEEHTRMLQQVKKNGGMMNHSDFLRVNSNRMNARQFREAVETLRQAKLLDYDGTTRTYYLTPEGYSRY